MRVMTAGAYIMGICVKVVVCTALLAGSFAGPGLAQTAAPLAATPAEAGLRYGQAAGAVNACPGISLTAKAEALTQIYRANDLEVFKAEAAKTIAAWGTALGCANINPETGRQDATCRHLKAVACRSAFGEIGPDGSIMPGLLDQTFAR